MISKQEENKNDSLNLQEISKNPIQFSYYCNISKILKQIGFNIPSLNKSTPFCKHSTGCLNNIISGTLQSFAIGYLTKTTINLLSVFIAFKKLIKQFIK